MGGTILKLLPSSQQTAAYSMLRIYESLSTALIQAHGTPMSVDLLSKTTALELLAFLAPNDIRFIFDSKGLSIAALNWPQMKDGSFVYPGVRAITSYAGGQQHGAGEVRCVYTDGSCEFKPDAWDHTTRLWVKDLAPIPEVTS